MSEVRKIEKWKSGSPEIRKFGKSEIWKFETSENRRIGKTEIQEIGKSERKGFLKNKRITGMSLSYFFTHTSGFPGLLATFILTDFHAQNTLFFENYLKHIRYFSSLLQLILEELWIYFLRKIQTKEIFSIFENLRNFCFWFCSSIFWGAYYLYFSNFFPGL